MSKIEERLEALGLQLPKVAAPVGTFLPSVRSGNLLFVSGQVPLNEDGSFLTGHVGADVSIDEAAAAARQVGLSLIAVARAVLESLDDIERDGCWTTGKGEVNKGMSHRIPWD